jgi:hypothetical protein
MSKSAFSILGWGLYEVGVGLGFLLIPNVLLPIFGFPTTTEVWIRVIGLIVLALALYHVHCARNNVIPFFQITIPGRVLFAIGLVALYAMGFAGPGLILFAVLEVAGAAWTWWALRTEQADTVVARRHESRT